MKNVCCNNKCNDRMQPLKKGNAYGCSMCDDVFHDECFTEHNKYAHKSKACKKVLDSIFSCVPGNLRNMDIYRK